MTKKEWITTTKVVNVSIDEAVDEIINVYVDGLEYIIDDNTDVVEAYIKDNEINLTSEEKEQLTADVLEATKKKLEIKKNDEAKNYANRDACINSITYLLRSYEYGHYLSAEDIVDLIIKNGNK